MSEQMPQCHSANDTAPDLAHCGTTTPFRTLNLTSGFGEGAGEIYVPNEFFSLP